jgi:hypothetical protein
MVKLTDDRFGGHANWRPKSRKTSDIHVPNSVPLGSLRIARHPCESRDPVPLLPSEVAGFLLSQE